MGVPRVMVEPAGAVARLNVGAGVGTTMTVDVPGLDTVVVMAGLPMVVVM